MTHYTTDIYYVNYMGSISNVHDWKGLIMLIIQSIRVLLPYENPLSIPPSLFLFLSLTLSLYRSPSFSLSPYPLDCLINPLTDLPRNTRTL